MLDNFSYFCFSGDNFFSYVMYRVRGCRVQRDKELKKRKMEAMRQAKRDREQEVIDWEKMLMKEPHETHMRAMWEVSHCYLACKPKYDTSDLLNKLNIASIEP